MSDFKLPRKSRVATLLATYYNVDEDNSTEANGGDPTNIDGIHFDAETHLKKVLKEKPLPELVSVSNELSGEIKTLDGNLQMLVYENYNKFLSATDTIRAMKHNVESIEEELITLSNHMKDINKNSDLINTNLADSRAKIEQLNAVRALVKKLQFIFELPSKLHRSVTCEAYTQAVKYYKMASEILDENSNIPSFRTIKDEADDIMHRLRAQLRDLIKKDEESLNNSDFTEFISLLLQLDEDDLTLRQQFLLRWTTIINNHTLPLKAPCSSAEENTIFIKKLHDGSIKNIFRFANDFKILFLDSNQLTQQAQIKARTQLDSSVCKFVDSYLSILESKLQHPDLTGSVLIEVLQQVDFNLQNLVAVVDFSKDLKTKSLNFAKKSLEQSICRSTNNSFLRFEELFQGITKKTTEIYAERLTKSPFQRPKNLKSDLSTPVILVSSEMKEIILTLCNNLQVLNEASNRDQELFNLTSELIISEMHSLHQKVHQKILLEASLVSGDPHFGTAASVSKDMLQHTLSSLLLARLSSQICEHSLWSPVFELFTKFPSAVKKLGGLSFSTNEMNDLWTKTSQMLLKVYVSWSTQQLSTILYSREWNSNFDEPTAVSPSIPQLINSLWMIQQDIFDVFDLSRKIPNEATIKLPTDDDRLCSIRGKGALIEKDIQRMFAAKDTTSLLQNIELSPPTALAFITKGVIQTTTELIRREVCLDLPGLHQLQVDVRCLRWGVYLLLDNAAQFDVLLDEIMLSASDRCMKPAPAESSIVLKCFGTMRAMLVFKLES
eukprot:c17635_g1_i1.p1 GENE.c17635_g1_i1~~c17635_g1_i1.p1  ORF type:complete len:796 (+),score=262.47 c17635_g1_i1:51-2390(+)